MAFKFENLRVWNSALELRDLIYARISEFPKREQYVLSAQMLRATDSIVLNIAEGSTSQSNPEYKKFLNYSIRSGIEVIACLHIAKRRNLINQDQFGLIYRTTERLIVSLQALKNSIK